MSQIPPVIEAIQKSGARKVRVAITDVDGVLRGKYIHIDKFLSAVESGFGFCNVVLGWDVADVCYDESKYTGWFSGYPDAQVRLDLNSFRRLPWDRDVPFFLGDFVDAAGAPLGVCPRQTLKRVIARAAEKGYVGKFALEFEFYNFKENPVSLREKNFANLQPLSPGMFGYSLLRAGLNGDYFNAIFDELGTGGVPIEGLHTETGPGVIEAAIQYSEALEAADRATVFKTGVKEIAYRFGIMPTFMARWNNALPGASGHIHQSLWKDDVNLFHDAGDPGRMSDPFRSYIAGQLKLLPELLPCFAPTVNSFKRLVEGFWAPTRANWGIENRTCALRVIPGVEKKMTRVETRVGGADLNAYLAIAAAFASGLYGIEHELELPAPVEGNAYRDESAIRLPATLDEAARKMYSSAVARELLGDAFVEHFATSRLWEWRQSQAAVTGWELERYFEII